MTDLHVGVLDADTEAYSLERWPHLATPGPQHLNRIAGTAEEQLRRALAPRPVEPLPRTAAKRLAATIREHSDVILPALMDALAEPLGELLAAIQGGTHA